MQEEWEDEAALVTKEEPKDKASREELFRAWEIISPISSTATSSCGRLFPSCFMRY